MAIPDGEILKMGLFVSTECTNVTDTQTQDTPDAWQSLSVSVYLSTVRNKSAVCDLLELAVCVADLHCILPRLYSVYRNSVPHTKFKLNEMLF